MKEQEFSNYPTVYVQIRGNKPYVGQAAGQSISTRLSQHFTYDKKDWVDSVLFFSRTDGKLSKADTDYLEKRLIQDFNEKSDYEMIHSLTNFKRLSQISYIIQCLKSLMNLQS